MTCQKVLGAPLTRTWTKVLGVPAHLLDKGFGCSSTNTGQRFWVLQYKYWKKVLGFPSRLVEKCF